LAAATVAAKAAAAALATLQFRSWQWLWPLQNPGLFLLSPGIFTAILSWHHWVLLLLCVRLSFQR
jgi:hypothetical protein